MCDYSGDEHYANWLLTECCPHCHSEELTYKDGRFSCAECNQFHSETFTFADIAPYGEYPCF